MCVFSRPKPPTLPEPRPTAPRPEPTADRVAIGQQRVTGQQTTEGQRRRERQSIRERRRLGTQSLQIPLLEQGMMGSGNLRY